MEAKNGKHKANINKWLMLIPAINIMLVLIIKTSVIAFETIYIIWSIFSYIIFIAYILSKIKEFNSRKSIFEENIQQKEKLLQKSEEVILKIQQKNINEKIFSNNIKDNLIDISNSLKRLIEKFELNGERESNQVQDSNDKSHKMLDFKDNILKEFDEEIKSILIVAKMITKISESSKNVNIMLEELLKSSKSIEKSVEEIQNISNETNILALNASIEAARAGENGLGFSVVSKEIRKLSEQTKGASLRIQEAVSEIQDKMKNAVETKTKGGDIVGECNIKSEEIVEKSKIIERDIGAFFEALTNIINSKNLDLGNKKNNSDINIKEIDYIEIINEFQSILLLTKKEIENVNSYLSD